MDVHQQTQHATADNCRKDTRTSEPTTMQKRDELLGEQRLDGQEEIPDKRDGYKGQHEAEPLCSGSNRAIESVVQEICSSHRKSQGNAAPVVASCRAESQAYMRELKDAHEKTKQDLRFEKDKNAMLVSRALELEKEKNALLAAEQAAASLDATPSRHAQWDKEQAQKIQATLKMTIEELQDDLNRKQEELDSCKERYQRERSRVKQLEDEVRSKETAERDTERVRKQLEADVREAERELAHERHNVQRAQERAQEERMIRDTLEEQVETLNEVNAALEQRCNALIRRVELSACVMQDCQDLKMQLRDAEIDNETLVRTIRELKDQHSLREKELRTEIENVREERHEVALQVQELEADLTSLRAQNSLFSEWMLVRNANATIAKKDFHDGAAAASPQVHPYHPSMRAVEKTSSSSERETMMRKEKNLYVHTSRVPQSPTKTMSMTTASPIKQQSWRAVQNGSNPSTPTLKTGSNGGSDKNRDLRGATHSPQRRSTAAMDTKTKSTSTARKMSTASLSSSSASSSPLSTASSSNNNADHERLRTLMSRNRELQQRLQQETLATQNLEQEITNITTSYPNHRQQHTKY